MKLKRILFAALTLLAFNSMIFAASKTTQNLTDEEAEIAEIVSQISEVGQPYLTGNYVVFTQPKDARYVAIAFEHEDFKQIHTFKIKKLYDYNDEESGSFFFYVMELPKNLQQVKYRLIIDGLWTTDPTNPEKIYDSQYDLYLSSFNASREIPETTESVKDGLTHFV